MGGELFGEVLGLVGDGAEVVEPEEDVVVLDVAAFLGVGEQGLDAAAGVGKLVEVGLHVVDAGELGLGTGEKVPDHVHCFLDQLLLEHVGHGDFLFLLFVLLF